MKKQIKLKTGLISRSFALTKLGAKLGKDIYLSKKDDVVEMASEILTSRANYLLDELGLLKGSFLKAGQILSLYSEDLLPPELSKLLSKLQSQNSYLQWDQIKKQIPKELQNVLKIEPDAFAAASIGQVHKAFDNEGKEYALKVQYNGIKKMIDADLKALRALLKIANIIPHGLNLDDIFYEIRQMLVFEMDYQREVQLMERYRKLLPAQYTVPRVYPKTLDDEIALLDLEQRNKLGREFLALFLLELFEWKLIQTDAHAGNYLIKDGKWVLLDFGATKEVSDSTIYFYQQFLKILIDFDEQKLLDLAKEMGAIDLQHSDLHYFIDYCRILSTPFQGKFDWASTDIVKEAMTFSKNFHKKMKFNFLPHENLFIDRKILGVFYMLKKLKVNDNSSNVVKDFLL
jgi:predicted unusual protein kinase regulating ubiquinone biosynthesis (AarF/ABC1/UbiB family)